MSVPVEMPTLAMFSRTSPNYGRFALGFAHLSVHADNQPEGAGLTAGGTPHDYVQDILNESANEWNAFLKFSFPYDLAKGATPLNGFRHYMIQDATHFEYFYRIRMEAISKSGTFQELKDFANILVLPASRGGLAAVQSGRDICTTQLGVSKDDVVQEPNSPELKKFIELVSKVAKEGDYLDSIIALLPGVLGYDIICKKLVQDPGTVRNTVYYTLLIEPFSKIPAMKHKEYINTHIANLPEKEREARWGGWVSNFKKGCEYETLFSGLATPSNFPAYKIVPDGQYQIRSYLQNNPYLAPGTADSVVTEAQKEVVWVLSNSPDGYSIRRADNSGQSVGESFLSTSVRAPLLPIYGVFVSVEDFRWSINSVQVKGPHGPVTAYQLLVPGNLQYVLDAGNNQGDPKVFVSNNSYISSQFWLLEPVFA